MPRIHVREIEFNPCLSDAFFEIKKEFELTPIITFPLPHSSEDLPSLLDSKSRASSRYKNNFSRIVNTLEAWGKKHHLITSACERFKKIYLDSDPNDKEQNKFDYYIYREGITLLSGITTLLNNEKIPLNLRIDITNNLLKGMMVCSAGAVTNITNAYLALLSLTNSSIYWMMRRRSLAEQIVLGLIADENLKLNIEEGMEIHYANGVLNRYADDIGIQMIPDEYVNDCKPDKLDILLDEFVPRIIDQMSVDTLIDTAFQSLSFDSLQDDINSREPARYADAMRRLDQTLATFGNETPGKLFYSEKKIISLTGEFDDEISLAWNAREIIIASIYSRFTQHNFVNLKENEKVFLLKDNAKIYHLTGHSLQLAYVITKKKKAPFISFCIEKLMLPQYHDKDALKAFLMSDDYPKSDAIEVVLSIGRYLKAHDMVITDFINDLIKDLLGRQQPISPENFKRILNVFPKDIQIPAIETLYKEKINDTVSQKIKEMAKPCCDPSKLVSTSPNAKISALETLLDDLAKTDDLTKNTLANWYQSYATIINSDLATLGFFKRHNPTKDCIHQLLALWEISPKNATTPSLSLTV
jgi:hypothetical protein